MKIIPDSGLLTLIYANRDAALRQRMRYLENCELVVSPEIFGEIERNLRRAEFNLAPNEIKDTLREILKKTRIVRIQNPEKFRDTSNPTWHLTALRKQTGADHILVDDTRKPVFDGLKNIISFSAFIENQASGNTG